MQAVFGGIVGIIVSMLLLRKLVKGIVADKV